MGKAIAFVLKGYPRLSETFIAQEIRGLELQGLDIRIVSLRKPYDATSHPIHEEIEAPVSYLPEYLHDAPLRVLAAWWKVRGRPGYRTALKHWLRDLKRDVSRNRIRRFGQALVMAAELPADVERLHAHFIHTPASVTRYASVITGLPWTCSAHAKDIWTSPDWELEEKMSSTGWVSVCTQYGAEHLRTLSAVPEKVRLIYHGIDLARFSNPGTGASKPDGSVATDPVQLITVGRAVQKKGIDTLLDALAMLPPDVHWHWTHIGGGELLPKLKRQAEGLKLGNRISWKGALSQTDVIEHYRSSDVFVLPCRIAPNGDRDGLPNVLMEAQSQALTCLSTPVSGVPELIVDGETGVLVPPDKPGDLAQALGRLCRNPDLRTQLGKAAENRVRSEFSYEGGIDALLKLFADEPPSAGGSPSETPGRTQAEPLRGAA
ncbi:MAG: glycosyltransferase family 4 protein [Alphaproteobacteria bacterium]|nr:glycosyltransferase family 4 protein [Alphaproteobacteria bacterium]